MILRGNYTMRKRKAKRHRLKKGYGSVYEIKHKNKNGEYYYREKPWVFRYDGKYIGYYETEEDAIAAAHEFHKHPVVHEKNTYAEVFAFWKQTKAPYLSDRTVYEYEKKFNNYCKPLHNRIYYELRPNDYYQILNSLDVSNATKNNLIKLFRAIDKCAFEMEIIDRKYTDSISYYKEEKTSSRKPFTEKEIAKLWENKDVEDVDLVLILIYTGMRPTEIELLKLKDIDDKFLKCGIKTDAGKNRMIPIHPKIKPLIEKRMKESKKDKFLNYSAKTLRIRFKTVMSKLNMEHIPYECRHTMITRLDNAGANKVCIDLIAGHESKSIGERVYTHKTLEQLYDTILLLN